MTKPAKPTADFPLFAHSNGRWAKKIAGKHVYFGSWKNPPEGDPTGAEAALREFVQRYPQKDGKILRVDSAHTKKHPLCYHKAVKLWYKTIRGRQYYFGKDLDAALKRYFSEKDDLEAGRSVRKAEEERDCRLEQLVNGFLTQRKQRVQQEEVSLSGYQTYKHWAKWLLRELGRSTNVSSLRPKDFSFLRSKLGEKYAPGTVKQGVKHIKAFFNWGISNEHCREVNFGTDFVTPKKSTLRRSLHERQIQVFSADDLNKALKHTHGPYTAMLLVGINCGMENSDVTTLEWSHLDLEQGWMTRERHKTGMRRRAKLWPETIEALTAWKANRPQPANERDNDLVFLRENGKNFITNDLHRQSQVADVLIPEFNKILEAAGVKKTGLSFGKLRHTFQTAANGVNDANAIRGVMGHAPPKGDMSLHYSDAEGDQLPLSSDDRLERVSEYVHAWMFGES